MSESQVWPFSYGIFVSNIDKGFEIIFSLNTDLPDPNNINLTFFDIYM